MIVLRGVRFGYSEGEPVLDRVDLDIPAGLTLLLGPNGCGKSTLMRIAAGVERPDAGSVAIDGHDLWKDEVAARASLAYVPEQPDLTPYATLEEILALVCRLRGAPIARAAEALERVGLAGLGRRSVRELSMGQPGAPLSPRRGSDRRGRSSSTSPSRPSTAPRGRRSSPGSRVFARRGRRS